MQRGGSDQFPIWMARWTVFAGKLNSDVGKEFYVFQIQSIGRCHRWRITVRGLKWTVWWNWRNKETRAVDSRIEQSSRLEHAEDSSGRRSLVTLCLIHCLGLINIVTCNNVMQDYWQEIMVAYLFNLGDSGVLRLGLNVLLKVRFFGVVIFT